MEEIAGLTLAALFSCCTNKTIHGGTHAVSDIRADWLGSG